MSGPARKQETMFTEGEDLPLFSGLPQAAEDSTFTPAPADRQELLPGMPAVDWEHIRQRDAEKRAGRRVARPRKP